jgi:transcription elongation factor Elf1
MQNDADEIHFDCPKCKRPMSGDKALIGELINCPDCGEPFKPFIPTPRKPEPTPEPPKPDIRLECPKCHHAVFVEEKKAMLYEFVTCPNCAVSFSPVPPFALAPQKDSFTYRLPSASPRQVPPFAPAPQNDSSEVSVKMELTKRREIIRRNAGMLSGIGGFFAVIGLIVGVFSIMAMKSGEDATEGFITSATLIGVGLWFYLVGQVVHIRANTEK